MTGELRVKYLLYIGTSLLVAVPALAQDIAVAQPDVAAGRDIVVLATGFAQPRDETGQAISVVDRARIDELQSLSIADALRTVPGATVAQRGPVGSQTSLFLRGGNSSQTLVLIDGVKVNDPSSPNAAFDFGSLLSGNTGRVEVLRGPNSIVWGSQAIGGVVNIESVRSASGFAATGAIEYGHADSVIARAGVSGGTERIEASFGATHYRSDGISAMSGGSERDPSRITALNGRIKLHLADGIAIDLRGYYTDARIDFDSAFSGGANARPVANNQQFVGYAGLNFDLAGGRWRNRVAYSRTHLDRVGTDPVVFSFNNYVVEGAIDRFEYRTSYDIADAATLTGGIEHERISASTSYEGFDPDRASNRVTGAYAQLTLRPVTGLTLTGGARHDDYSVYGGHTTLGGNLAYTPNGGATMLRATYGEGFRAPTLTEGQPPYGNSALKPETARNVDIGVEQSLIGGAVRASVTWFSRRSTNLIVYSFAAGRSENIGKAEAEGFEFGLAAEPTARLRVAANFTITDAFNRSGANAGKRLELRPQHVGYVSVDWDGPYGVKLGMDLRLAGDSFDNAANTVRLDGYAVASLRAAVPVASGIELYGRVENLFDAGYVTVAGYSTYGRAGYAGVRARF